MNNARPFSPGRLLPLVLIVALFCGCDTCGTGPGNDMLPAFMEAVLTRINSIATGNDIAVWAFPDGRDVTGTIHVGVVAYGRKGIGGARFSVDGGDETVVSGETMNPDTGEYEFVFTLDTAALGDGVHTIGATVGYRALSPITIYVANGTSGSTWYVSASGDDVTGDGSIGNPWKTLGRALGTEDSSYTLTHAAGGDTVLVRQGVYDLPQGARGDFARYVTIRPYNSEAVGVRGGTLRSTYLKFENINFGFNGGGGVTMYGHHLWFKGCTYTGAGKNYPDTINEDEAFRSREVTPGKTAFAHDVIVENCTVHDANQGISLIGTKNYIIRQCTVYDQNGDAMKFQGSNVLITGNTIYNVIPPVAWSVSYSVGPYNCDGVTLEFHVSRDGGESYDAVAVPLAGGSQTLAQVVAQLNASADFTGAGLSAGVTGPSSPVPGRPLVYQTDHDENFRFYITGGDGVFNFRDNTRDQNAISAEFPAYHTSDHCDYIANDAGNVMNVVIRNNLMYGGESQGLKLDGIGSVRGIKFYKRDIAVINNCIAGTEKSARLIYMNRRGSGLTGFRSVLHYEGIIIAHNTIYKPATGTVRAAVTMDLDNPHIHNMLITNNVIGDYYCGDWWIDDSSWTGYMDYNCFTGTAYSDDGAANNAGSIIGDPLFADPANNDYSLQASSPAKGAGDPSPGIPYDIGWNLRSGSAPSIGCYE